MPPIDTFKNYMPGLDSPAPNFGAVTPNDSTELTTLPRYLIIGTAGTLVLTDANGNDVSLPVQAGQTVVLRPTKVKATGTTASGIVAAW